MKHIIEEYGGVILAVIGVLLLVGVISIVSEAVSTGTQKQIDKMEEKIDSTSSNTNNQNAPIESMCNRAIDEAKAESKSSTYNKGAYAPFIV